jgi:hydroxymethylbilane synthase
LALTQANWLKERLNKKYRECKVELVVIKTKGDIMQDVALVKIGGKGVFVKEIEDALLRGEIDLAVHSMKDVPAVLPEGLEIAVTPEREDPRDVLVARDNLRFERLPHGARIGTGSLRRQCQLHHLYKDVNILTMRGNLDTRIRKIETENLHGIIVAAAGMRRMGWTARISHFIPPELMIPAVGQGVLALELRQDNLALKEALAFLNHERTWREVTAERAFLKRLGGGCQLPIAAYAELKGETLFMNGLIGSTDGLAIVRNEFRAPWQEGEDLGIRLAEDLLGRGGQAIMDLLYH